MPIPTDLLIIFAGIRAGRSFEQLGFWFLILNTASVLGASGLYAIIRRGGRPLIERYGRYVHLGPEQINRAERLLARGGWMSIAVGRAIPGLRYLAVIACGLLEVPYLRFVTAHIVGSSVYIAAFLALGATFGPVVVDYLHQPEFGLRLLWLLALSVGLPALLAWLCYRGHAEYRVAPSRRRTLGALLLASFAGMTSMAAAWAVAATFTAALGQPRQLNLTFSLANELLGRGLRPATAYMLVYTVLLLLCVAIGVLFYDVALPILARRGTSLARQALGLALLCVVMVSSFLLPSLLMSRAGPIDRWVQAGGPYLGAALLAGILCYAFTTACARALAIAVLPSARRKPQASAPSAPDTTPLSIVTPPTIDPAGENKA